MDPPRTHARTVIAHHLIFSGYGFWLANDPRGSGSTSLRQDKFDELGPIHPGRKKEQPKRSILRQFYEQANPLLRHVPLWFDDGLREAIADSFGQSTGTARYTVWAFAVLRNHAHLCIRQHRDRYQAIWSRYADGARDVASRIGRVSPEHPVWAQRPYSVYLYSPDDIWRTIRYIQDNPAKEGLPAQNHAWVQPYNGWPFAKSVPPSP